MVSCVAAWLRGCVQVLQHQWGLVDVADASEDFLSKLTADLSSGKDSVIGTAFGMLLPRHAATPTSLTLPPSPPPSPPSGFMRRLQPSMAVTHQQAAASLAVGQAAAVVKQEAESVKAARELAQLVGREEARVEAVAGLQEEAAGAVREREEVGWEVERERERLEEVQDGLTRGRREVEEEREAMRPGEVKGEILPGTWHVRGGGWRGIGEVIVEGGGGAGGG